MALYEKSTIDNASHGFPMFVKQRSFHNQDTQSYQENTSWEHHQHEGRLAVDVIETEEELIILSTIAGAKEDAFDISVHDDLLTIRGVREYPIELQETEASLLHEECYWGPFSRTIVLPVEVKTAAAHAEYKHGVLTVKIPKEQHDRRIPIVVVEE